MHHTINSFKPVFLLLFFFYLDSYPIVYSVSFLLLLLCCAHSFLVLHLDFCSSVFSIMAMANESPIMFHNEI